jgi:DNA-binding NarL/FixJ family response regulator
LPGLFQSGVRALHIKILIADDKPAFRKLLREMLMGHPCVSIVAEVEDGVTAVQKAKELEPDMVLLDISMPLMNGIEAARNIKRASPTAKIIFLTENLSMELLLEALCLGANGYLIKSLALNELVPAIRSAHYGRTYVSSYFRWEENG